jgi:hypothetical protein
LGQILAVAGIVGEGNRVFVQDLDEALRPPAMLNVWLAVCRRGCKVKTVGVGEKARKLVVDFRAPAAVVFDRSIDLAGSPSQPA